MRGLLLLVLFYLSFFEANAQGMHFSQYYNAPLLASPANTALMPEYDYRAGVLYRDQWSNIPAPFKTFSAFGDFKVLKNNEGSNWLGIGAAFYNDKAGAGDLALTKLQLNIAYHLQMGLQSMLSVGIGAAYVQRSVNFSKLTYDVQWDGFRFNPDYSNGEKYAFQKTNYADLSAGFNYAFFPNENLYLKIGIGLDHVNTPKESFYQQDNQVGMRPVGNIDFLLKLDERWIAELSSYYTTQKGASELLFGGLVSSNVAPIHSLPTVLKVGGYYRLGDAVIPVLGLEWNRLGFMASMDISASSISAATGGKSAFEVSIIYKGLYDGSRSRDRGGYNCPRF